MPTRKSENCAYIHPSRLPLGTGWEGSCTAPGAEGTTPAGVELTHCNLGYATECPRLPKERKWDAVRFAVTNDHDSRVCLAYVCEKNHLPCDHGRLEYSVVLSRWLNTHYDARIQRMAECFLDSWFAKSRPGVEAETAPEKHNEATQIVNERS